MQTDETELLQRKEPPDIAIEWKDVEIQIKVLRTDIPSEENHFVRFVSNREVFTSQVLHFQFISSHRSHPYKFQWAWWKEKNNDEGEKKKREVEENETDAEGAMQWKGH